MKTLLLTLLMLTLLVGGCALAQTTENAVVTDNTPADSPVSLTTTFTCTETVPNWIRDVGTGSSVITNKSKRTILGVTVALIYHCIRVETAQHMYQHDFFFKRSGLAPGDTLPIPLEIDTSMPVSQKAQAHPSFVTVQVVYVQYDDGTFWGDPNAKSSLDQQRLEERDFYTGLQGATSEPDFTAKLNAPKVGTASFAAAHPVKMALSQSGYSAALAVVNDRLSLANTRYSTGKF